MPASRPFHFLSMALIVLSVCGYPIVAALTSGAGIESRIPGIMLRALVVLVSLVLLLNAISKRRLVEGLFWIPFATFWLLYSYRMTVDLVVFPQTRLLELYEYAFWALGACLIPSLAACNRFARYEDDRCRHTMTLFLLLAALMSLAAAAYAISQGYLRGLEVGRIETEKLNPISLGHLSVSLVVIAFHSLFIARARSSATFMFVIALIVGVIGAGLAASRGPIVAGVVALACAALFSRSVSKWKLILVSALIVLLVAPMWTQMEDELGIRIVERLLALSDSSGDETSLTRLESYRIALEQFSEGPLLGATIEDKESLGWPHNLFLEALMATGVIGGAALFLVMACAARNAITVLRSDSAAAWLPLLFLQHLVGAQFSAALYSNATLWVLTGAMLAALPKSSARSAPQHRSYPTPMLSG